MGYKCSTAGTPSRASGQPTITAMWKRPYQTRSPAKACATGVEEEDIHMDNASVDETRVVATEQVEARDDIRNQQQSQFLLQKTKCRATL